MDVTNALEAIEAAVDGIVATVAEADRPQLDEALAQRYGRAVETVGPAAVGATVETVASSATSETPTPEAPTITSEGLLATLDTALTTYGSQLDTVNTARDEAKGRKRDKPAPLEAVDHNVIRAEVEALAADPAILADLQAEADYFTANPETNSPAVGFDIIVVPEGLTATDEQAIAKDVQAKITKDYTPYIRDARYNDKRTSEATGKGYRVAFAPRHYNVPSGTTNSQTNWMNNANESTSATQLQTATDGEALAQINNLHQADGELNDPTTRYDKTYFRRFDQAPVDDVVSSVRVSDFGELGLGRSFVGYGRSARVLVVPQKLNA